MAEIQGQPETNAAAVAEAQAKADALNANLLASQQERKYASLEDKHQALATTCSNQEFLITELQGKVAELKSQVNIKKAAVTAASEQAESEAKRASTAEEREKDVNERMARIDAEADSLRQEISRLQSSNTALNAQITELNTSSTLSTSSTAPLQFENTRLRSELDSLNAHCKWLETELNSRTSQTSELKINHSKTVHELRNDLNSATAQNDDLSSQVSSLKMHNESIKTRLESSQKTLLQKEQDHADAVHELNLEVQMERRLVSLNKENVARLEESYNDVVREMTSMKALAAAAEEEHKQEFLAIKAQMEEAAKKALEQAEQENEMRIVEYQQELNAALAEKAQLEDEFMAAGAGRIAGGDQVMRLTNGSEDEPITLTKVYEMLEEAQDETRKERAERRRLELYLERVQKEIESVAPRQRLERKEFELAMKQNQEMHSRLNEAMDQTHGAKDELKQAKRQLTETTRECNELRLENTDMAKQVQALLQKSMGGEDLAAEMQNQNQRLMKEHHRMSTTISELEEKLDTDTVQQKLQEFDAMVEERDNQATLVSNIVQQRDLYRALLVKNDASLLAEYGADGAIVAAKDQIEKYTDIESKNKELVESVSKLTADLNSVTNEKIGIEERLARLDAHANELSVTNTGLQADLTAAHGAAARSNAEATFHMEKVGRLEESMEAVKNDLHRLNNDKNNLQRLSEELQSALSVSRDEESKMKEQLRQANVQVRLAETNCNTLKDNESRLNADNNSLRSELARHIALQESMQKIEASLSSRENSEQDRLGDEVRKLKEDLSRETSKHSLSLEKLQNQLADAELQVQVANKEKEEALAKVIAAKDDLVKANANTQTFADQNASLEKELNAAKIKLGDQDVDTSDKERIENLVVIVETTKEELKVASQKAEDYKKMAQTSEKTLADATKASEEFKKLTLDEIKRLKDELNAATESARVKQEALEELTNDLSISRGEQEKVVDDLKAKIDALKTQLEDSKSSEVSSQKQREDAIEEMKIYKAEATVAKDNYERELALHADARKELMSLRAQLQEEARLCQDAKSKLGNYINEAAAEKNAWEETKKHLEETQKLAEVRLSESQKQNDILHSQLAKLNESIEKIQAEKINNAADSAGTAATTSDDTSSLQKQVSELRDIVRFMRNEKDVIETQLESARRTAERERAAAEIAKHSLSQLRGELEIMQNQEKTQDVDGKASEALEAKMKQTEDQLMLLRESNTLLRAETEKLRESVTISKKEVEDANAALEPSNARCKALEVDNSALEAEKASLIREVDAWKDRVQGLVKKFNQIDPQEHANALKKVEETEKECMVLRSAKEKAEKETVNIKSLVSRLNKEMSKQRSMVESSKAALSKAIAEKESLMKKTSSADDAKREVEEVQKAKKQIETQLKSAKSEYETQSNRLENLKKILRQNRSKVVELQQKMETSAQKEKEMAIQLTKEKEAHNAAVKELSKLKASSQDKPADVAMKSAPVSKKAPTEEANLQKSSVPKTSTSEPNASESVPPIPKVPEEGFKFVPSRTATAGKNNLENENINRKADSVVEQKPKPKETTTAGKANAKKVATPLKSVTEAPVPAKNNQTTSKAVSLDGRTEESKKTSKAATGQSISLDIKTEDKVKASESKAGKTEEPKKSEAMPVNASTATSSSSKKATKAESLREKLMKKKRDLELLKLGNPPAKRVARSTPAKSAANSQPIIPEKKTNNPDPVKKEELQNADKKDSSKSSNATPSQPVKIDTKDKNLDQAKKDEPQNVDKKENLKSSKMLEVEGVKEGEIKNIEKPVIADQEKKGQNEEGKTEKQAPVSGGKSVSGLNANAAPFKMFGSGNADPVFGKASSVGGPSSSGPSIFGKPSSLAPAIGEPSKSEEAPKNSGAFLDLKPPGSGSSTPLLFGSSTKITLPTPSKDKLPNPFASFQSQPFGSNPFGSSAAGAANLPFGGANSKKRALDSDKNVQNSAPKLAKVEEEKSETSTEKIDSADSKPESES